MKRYNVLVSLKGKVHSRLLSKCIPWMKHKDKYASMSPTWSIRTTFVQICPHGDINRSVVQICPESSVQRQVMHLSPR